MYNNNNLKITKFLFLTLTAMWKKNLVLKIHLAGFTKRIRKNIRVKTGRGSENPDGSLGKRGKNRRNFGILLKSEWAERN